jgi:hypothetical protein
MSRIYGARYETSRDTKEVAKVMRSEIRAQIRAGAIPRDWRISVRLRRCTWTRAIDITARSPRPIYEVEPRSYPPFGPVRPHPRTGEPIYGWVDALTIEARRVYETLQEIHEAHNHDGSDVVTDYVDRKYLGSVALELATGVLPGPTPAPART